MSRSQNAEQSRQLQSNNTSTDMPTCTQGCASVFHMTGGYHKTTCPLRAYDSACGTLDYMKVIIMSGEKIPQRLIDSLSTFVESSR